MEFSREVNEIKRNYRLEEERKRRNSPLSSSMFSIDNVSLDSLRAKNEDKVPDFSIPFYGTENDPVPNFAATCIDDIENNG